MTADEKIAHQRLSVLQLAEVLGNVSEACRQRDISRTQFYEYKRRVSDAWDGRAQGLTAHSQKPSLHHAAGDSGKGSEFEHGTSDLGMQPAERPPETGRSKHQFANSTGYPDPEWHGQPV